MQGASAELRAHPIARPRAIAQLRRRLALAEEVVTWRDVAGAVAAVVGALLAAGWSLQLWHAHLHVPLAYGSDALNGQMFINSVVHGGWIWNFHGMGAPFGAEQYDFPVGTDDLNFLTMKVMSIVTSDSGKVMNLFFLFTFVTAALSSYIVLRWLGVSIIVAVVASILFADAPYHLFRSEAHLLLSSYPSIPMGTYLILNVLDGGGLLRARAARGGPRRWLTGRNLFMVIVCVAIGSLGIYYAVFTALLVGAAGVIAPFAHRSWRPLAEAAVVCALIGATTFVNDLPAASYRGQHGTDAQVAHRIPAESELYALKLAEMVLPVPGDRIGSLARIRYKYDSTTPIPSEDAQQSLGLEVSLALLWMFLLALATVAGFRGGPGLRRQRQLAFAAVSAFLIGTLGGVSALIGYLVTTQIRGWDRISIFIDFFAVAALALGVDAVRRKARGRARYAWGAGLVVLLLFGIFDQSSTGVIPPYAANDKAYGSDAKFTLAMQHVVPPGSTIFELPYVPYPENPPFNRMVDYDLARPWVHTTTGLRFSYGAMKGRPQDWAADANGLPVPTLVDGLVAAGFSGIYVDRFGYADGAAALTAELRHVLGVAPIESQDDRLLFFDLRPYAATVRTRFPAGELLALRHALLYATAVAYNAGFYNDESGSRWTTPNASAQLDNTTGTVQRMIFAATVFSAGRGHWQLHIRTPDGVTHRVALRRRPRHVEFTFALRPGSYAVTFTSNAPIVHVNGDPRALAVRYQDLTLDNAAIAPFSVAAPSAATYTGP